MSRAIACPPPQANPRPPRVPLPAQACDAHAHVLGPQRRYPYVAARSYTPPDALLDDYLKVIRTLGIGRLVLVQPSVHGVDNAPMMEATATIRRDTQIEPRAVVVVPADAPDRALEALHAGGARGVRLNLIYEGGGVNLDAAARIADRIRPLGWHLQLLVDVSVFPMDLAALERLRVPLVFDHLGHLPARLGTAHPGFQALLELLKRGNTWVKASGAYRLTGQEWPYADVRPFAEAALAAAPQRVVWGTDWPHTVCRVAMPNDGDLADLLADWAGDAATLERVLVANPAALYDF